MRERLLNSSTLAGIGSLVLSILPFIQEGSTMNPTGWTLVIIGAILILWGTLKPNKKTTYIQMKEIVKKREEYLPKLENAIEKKVDRHNYLMDKASKTTFGDYAKKYFWGNKEFQNNLKKHPGSINYATQMGLYSWGFMRDNLLYKDLKKADTILPHIDSEYNILYSQIDSKILKLKLNSDV